MEMQPQQLGDRSPDKLAGVPLTPRRRVDSQEGRWREREQSIEGWHPVNARRNAKWWYSAFHNVTAMVGAGVLGLPYAMSELGWGAGVAVLLLSWVITLYTLWQMVEMHECVPGKRFDRYHELGQHAFGDRLGLWIVVPQQLVVEVGLNIVYMVTGGQSLRKFHDVVCDGRCKSIRLPFLRRLCHPIPDSTISASAMAQPGLLSSLRSRLRSAPPPPHHRLQPCRGYHVELGAREKALLEEDVALKRFKSYKNSVKQVSKIGNVLTLAVVLACSYEIAVLAVSTK